MREVLLRTKWAQHVGLVAGVLLGIFVILSIANRSMAHEALDCDDNAIIYCGIDHHNGTNDIDELKQKWRENQGGNLQALFAAFGIQNEAAFDGMVEGHVTGNNEVYVGSRLVANNAFTAGRQDISNDRGSSTKLADGLYYRQPSVSFANPSGSLRALVKMEGDTFKYAVILACGNPVRANPVAPPAQPVQQPTTPPPTTQPTPTVEVRKDVRIKGETQWRQEVTARPGDHVEFRIVIRNSGRADLQNVQVRDVATGSFRYVDSSLRISGSSSGDLFGTGLNMATISRGQQREITFEHVVDLANQTCSSTLRIRNEVFVKANNVAEKNDDAIVRIRCEQPTGGGNITPAVTTPAPAPTQPPQVLIAASTPVRTIPDTGMGLISMASIFATVTLGGAAAHYWFMRRLTS